MCSNDAEQHRIDVKAWKELGIEPDFAEKQFELSEAYNTMGAYCTNTCTPYLCGNTPMMGEHIAWGESSAIAFVNSVLGARTNREGGPTALAAAVTGRIPEYGLHLDKNRKGQHIIKVEKELLTDADFASLGYYTGQIVGRDIPVFTGINNRPTLENLKALSAALASSGAVALFHIVGSYAEAPTLEAVVDRELPIHVFGEKEYAQRL